MTNKYKIVISFLLLVIFAALIFVFSFKEEKVYTSHEYNSNGQLIGINEYIIRNSDTILQGKFERYNDKGIIISKGQFLNDEPYGKCSYYYDDGKIEAIQFKKNSKITLEAIKYNRRNFIKKYVMCNTYGEAKFIIEFDNKITQRYTGYSTYPVKQYKLYHGKEIDIKTGDILKVGDTIRYDYLIANIPYAKRTLKIETEGIDNSKINRRISKKAPTSLIVEEILTKRGLNRIKAITQYVFDDKFTPVKNDTVSFDIEVH
ncbi:hypothetical protein V3Q77_01470 [Flavobacterium davisii]|uniref:MORN repeat variant n=1 Tax=Flavobacterium davisii TaxID=2906077 RepID=A0ABW8PLN4_9FLAO